MASPVRTQASSGSSRTSGAPTKASLTPETAGAPMRFHFNPQKVQLSKSSKTEGSRGVITNQFEDAVKAVGNLTITLSECHFTGTTTKACCDRLVAWATPVAVPGTGRGATGGTSPMRSSASSGTRSLTGGSAMQSASTTRTPAAPLGYQGAGTTYKLPILLFSWGGGGGSAGLSYKVVLEKVDIHFERFSSTGAPVWAKVNLTLKEWEDAPLSTNPTSGGQPGRTKHVVTAGDSIVRIANQSYGTPNAWRVVADVNGLDDPLRVRPGRLLDLPGPTELEDWSES
jgi:nucleoid-associated protein YgaU